MAWVGTLGKSLLHTDVRPAVIITFRSVGRFFAVHALKVMLGHLLIRYEFEHLAERPRFAEMGDAVMPSEKTIIQIRRRESCDD